MFLDPDERLILFHQRMNPLTAVSLASFHQVGIETVHLGARWVSWHEIEPSPGTYIWDMVDEVVDRTRQAGLKAILDVYWRAPDWLEGTVERFRTEGTWWLPPDRTFNMSWLAVHPFDADAMAREAEFLERVCERYAATDVLCRYGMPYSAERILPQGLVYTEAQVVEAVLARQHVFAKYNSELWTSFHPGPATGITSVDGHTPEEVGNEHIRSCYRAMAQEFPGHVINRFVTEFFEPGGPYRHCVIDGVKLWAGAQYTTRVARNARRICSNLKRDQWDVWGLIMAHRAFSAPGHDQPGPEAYKQVGRALRRLAYRGG